MSPLEYAALLEETRTAERAPGAAIASVAMALPARVVGNETVAERLGVDAGWIASRTGIRERRIAAAGDTLTELASLAGQRALELAEVPAGDIDLVLVATLTAERRLPNAAPLVAERLGTRGAGAIDIGAACNGFVSALALAAAQVEAARARAVLVIGADILSRVTDVTDKRTAGLFADGAGAVVVSGGTRQSRIGPVVMGSDGSESELITLERRDPLIRMNGHDTFRHAVARMSAATVSALDLAGLRPADIDLFVYHQANSRILSAVGEQLGLEAARVADYMASFGNTSSASVPIALASAELEGRLWPGARVLLAAFGAGLTWSALTLEWGSDAS